MSPLKLPPFGVSQFTTLPLSFEEDVELYAGLGIEHVEVAEDKLDATRTEEQLSLLEGSGLGICSVQPSIRTLYPSRTQPEPVAVEDRVSAFRTTIERFGDRAEGLAFVCNSGVPPDGNIQEFYEVGAREYRALADFAAERGALLAFEPLSPVLMNVESAVWTLDQAQRLVEAVDRENFGLCVDFWNVWQSPGIREGLHSSAERVFSVHISDWRTPRSFEDRAVVGSGEIPTRDLVQALQSGGYRGPYALEIFSSGVPDALWESDLETVITRSREGFYKACEDL